MLEVWWEQEQDAWSLIYNSQLSLNSGSLAPPKPPSILLQDYFVFEVMFRRDVFFPKLHAQPFSNGLISAQWNTIMLIKM